MGMFCYGPRGRMNTWLFLSKSTGIARRGVLKELEVCDIDKTWSACQRDDGSCCEKLSEFFMVTFFIIRQNVNMATNAILYSGLAPVVAWLSIVSPRRSNSLQWSGPSSSLVPGKHCVTATEQFSTVVWPQ